MISGHIMYITLDPNHSLDVIIIISFTVTSTEGLTATCTAAFEIS